MLVLPIKKQWLEMIVSGEKKEEYREIKPYWTKRFENDFNAHKVCNNNLLLDFKDTMIYGAYRTEAIFKNGYSKNSHKIKCKVRIKIDEGKVEWGAEEGKEYYILEILKILEVKKL